MLPLLILVTIFTSSFFQLSYGTICTFTIGPITVTCPLGFVEISAASRRLIPELLIPAAIALVATILFGRAIRLYFDRDARVLRNAALIVSVVWCRWIFLGAAAVLIAPSLDLIIWNLVFNIIVGILIGIASVLVITIIHRSSRDFFTGSREKIDDLEYKN